MIAAATDRAGWSLLASTLHHAVARVEYEAGKRRSTKDYDRAIFHGFRLLDDAVFPRTKSHRAPVEVDGQQLPPLRTSA
jgi:hypothetical protein